MNILVCISHVPDTISKINFKENNTQFDNHGVQYIINPYDEFVLAKALDVKQQHGAKITVALVGDASTESTLRKAMALGVDEAIRVHSETTDGYSVAIDLAMVVESSDFQLIMLGKESSDYNGAMVPAMLAAKLNYDFVNACIGLEIEGETAIISREIETGKEILTCKMPMVIAGQKGLVEENDLKIPSMRGLMMARKKPIKILESKQQVRTTEVVSYENLDAKKPCQIIDSSNVKLLAKIIYEESKSC